MSVNDKDKFQKQQAIKFCVSIGLIPFLEANVANRKEITETDTFLTDIDALGVEIHRNKTLKRIIFDCKTVSKMSPINRAFWASGLMKYTDCHEAFVILKKKPLDTHRLSAKALNVHLYTEENFESYAAACSIDYRTLKSYAADIDNWHRYYGIFNTNPHFRNLGDLIRNQLPLENDFAKGFRNFLASSQTCRGELNPDKIEHMAIYASMIFSCCYLLAPIVNDIFDIFDPTSTKSDFENTLRLYIWGGRDGYAVKKKIHDALKNKDANANASMDLRNWNEFLELIRTFLDSPNDLSSCCLPMRELSLRYISKNNKESDTNITMKFKSNNRIRQYIFRTSKYLLGATGAPKEFHENFIQTINELID